MSTAEPENTQSRHEEWTDPETGVTHHTVYNGNGSWHMWDDRPPLTPAEQLAEASKPQPLPDGWVAVGYTDLTGRP